MACKLCRIYFVVLWYSVFLQVQGSAFEDSLAQISVQSMLEEACQPQIVLFCHAERAKTGGLYEDMLRAAVRSLLENAPSTVPVLITTHPEAEIVQWASKHGVLVVEHTLSFEYQLMHAGRSEKEKESYPSYYAEWIGTFLYM